MVARFTLVLLSSISLSACAGHPVAAPLVPLPTAYRAAPLETTGLRASQIEANWWRAFGDDTLNRVVEGALRANLDIEVAAARLQQAAGAAQVAGSNRLPSATVEASGSRQRQSLDDPLARLASSSPGYDRVSSQYGLGIASSWELDIFGRLAATQRAAKADEASAVADLAGVRLTVAAEVATTYITARELQARLQLARRRVDASERIHALVSRRLAEGSASNFERDQADAELARSRALLPLLEAALDEAYNRIDLLSGRAPGEAASLLGDGPVPQGLSVAVEDGPAALLVRRPDIYAAERDLAAADARVTEALTAYYPRLTVQGLVGLLSSGWSDLFTDEALQAAGTAIASGRLFDFGAAKGGVTTARGRALEAAATYKRTVLRAAAEAEDGLSRLSRSNRHAGALSDSRGALARSRDTAFKAYEIGGVTLQDALDLERRLLALDDTLATAKADTARASVTLFRVFGGGWVASGT